MPIRIECQSCKSPLKVPDEIQGEKDTLSEVQASDGGNAVGCAAPAALKPPSLPQGKAQPVRPKDAIAKGPPPLPRSPRHFADYISRVDVPQSKFAFLLEGGKQIRYLAIRPQSRDTIESIEFVKGPHQSAPVIMAVTLEALKPGTKTADAKKPNPNTASKKDSAAIQPEQACQRRQNGAEKRQRVCRQERRFQHHHARRGIVQPAYPGLEIWHGQSPCRDVQYGLGRQNQLRCASLGLPAKNVKEIPADNRFDFIKDALMKTRNSKFTAEKDVSQNTIPGKEYMIEFPNGQARMQLYTVAGWVIYAIVEGQTRDQVASAQADAFFASLKLSDKARDGASECAFSFLQADLFPFFYPLFRLFQNVFELKTYVKTTNFSNFPLHRSM